MPPLPPGPPAPCLQTPLPPPMQTLDPTLQLALFLAHERALGGASRYAPYVASLPAVPPCGWWLGPERLAAELAALGERARGGGQGRAGGEQGRAAPRAVHDWPRKVWRLARSADSATRMPVPPA